MSLKRFSYRLNGPLAVAMLAGAPFSAWAQTAVAPASAEPVVTAVPPENGLEDIIVRANKGARVETAQHVPIAVTALSEATIRNTQAVNIVDVSRVAPNVTFTAAGTLPGFANFQIRGIGVFGSTNSIDPAVNVVVDGMVYDFQGGVIQDAFDLESIEILRGPQGTLFGRNTTGGAVSLRTKRPGNALSASAELTVGNYDRIDFAASVQGALVDDRLLAKLTVLRRNHDGYVKDTNGGTFVPAPFNPSGLQPATDSGPVNDVKTWVIRPTLVFKPTETVDVSLLGEVVRTSGGGAGIRVLPGFEALLLAKFGYTPPKGKWVTNIDTLGSADIDADRLVLEANWDVGVGKITSITGGRKVDYGFSFDSDGTPFPIFNLPEGNIARSRQYSEELRFASDFSNKFDFVVGGYYDHHKLFVRELRNQSNLIANPAATTFTNSQRQGEYTQRSRASALFLNMNWHALEALTFTAGGRYSWEHKAINIAPLGVCTGPNFTGCPDVFTDQAKSWKNFSPKLGVQYEAATDILLYGSWTKGFRSGNFNGRATNLGQLGPVNPEQASSFEAGLKSTFLNRRARVNLTGFYTKYDDLQLNILQGALQVLRNAGAATFKGIELETTLKPVNALELTGSFGWTDAQYDRLDGPLGGGLTIAQSLQKKLVKVPKFTAYGSAAYTIDLEDIDTSITARAAYAWRSRFYVDAINSAFALQRAYGTLDLSLTATKGNWRATAFGRNVLDKSYLDLANTLFVPVFYGGEPATYGLTLGYSF